MYVRSGVIRELNVWRGCWTLLKVPVETPTDLARRDGASDCQSPIATDFTSVYTSMPILPFSRPQPDCLKPPKGRPGA